MAMRSALARIPRLSRSATVEGSVRRSSHYFSDGKGKVLSEEERAAENIYIQKMERERSEKMKLKAEKEKPEVTRRRRRRNQRNPTKGDAATDPSFMRCRVLC